MILKDSSINDGMVCEAKDFVMADHEHDKKVKKIV
jgi:hypothetical protein